MSKVEIDDNIAKDVSQILESLGLSLEQAINIFLHQVKIQNGIPFEIKNNQKNNNFSSLNSFKKIKFKAKK